MAIKIGGLTSACGSAAKRMAVAACTVVLAASTVAAAEPVTIVVLGDSLVAGYQLDAADAFPAKLEAALKARGETVKVVNAGVSGDTASNGLARVDWAVGDDADAVILELGANDALRGLDPKITRSALDRILARLTERRIPVLIAGMIAPPNMGEAYGAAFNPIFPDLAAKYGAALYPFFLDGVVADRRLNLPDGMHPNPAGIAVMVERIMPAVERLIAKARTRI